MADVIESFYTLHFSYVDFWVLSKQASDGLIMLLRRDNVHILIPNALIVEFYFT